MPMKQINLDKLEFGLSGQRLQFGTILLKENIFKRFIQFKHYKRYVCMHECNHIRAHQLKMVGYDEFLSY